MDTEEQGNADRDNSQEGNAGESLVRTSVPAAVACLLGAASLLLAPGMIWAFRSDTPKSVQSLYLLALFGTSFLAGVLGIVGLVQIGTSGGRFAGRGFACMGVGVPAAQILCFFFLVPVLARVHCKPFRMTCGTNLSGIGKAMLIYANDFEDELPRAGGLSSQWTGRVADWASPTRHGAYGLSPNMAGGRVSVSASLYLLVKYEEVSPKSFLCRGGGRQGPEKGVTEFTANTYRVADPKAELIDFWDFGPNPPKHCSYAYQMVYGASKLTVAIATPAGFAIMADRNPWMDSPSAKARDFSEYLPDLASYNGTSEQAKRGNSSRHEGEGQNVLFLDCHVDFEKRPYCSLNNDNIYTSWNGERARGTPPKLGSVPADPNDSLLVNDPVQPSR
jgi:hypothetical protein